MVTTSVRTGPQVRVVVTPKPSIPQPTQQSNPNSNRVNSIGSGAVSSVVTVNPSRPVSGNGSQAVNSGRIDTYGNQIYITARQQAQEQVAASGGFKSASTTVKVGGAGQTVTLQRSPYAKQEFDARTGKTYTPGTTEQLKVTTPSAPAVKPSISSPTPKGPSSAAIAAASASGLSYQRNGQPVNAPSLSPSSQADYFNNLPKVAQAQPITVKNPVSAGAIAAATSGGVSYQRNGQPFNAPLINPFVARLKKIDSMIDTGAKKGASLIPSGPALLDKSDYLARRTVLAYKDAEKFSTKFYTKILPELGKQAYNNPKDAAKIVAGSALLIAATPLSAVALGTFGTIVVATSAITLGGTGAYISAPSIQKLSQQAYVKVERGKELNSMGPEIREGVARNSGIKGSFGEQIKQKGFIKGSLSAIGSGVPIYSFSTIDPGEINQQVLADYSLSKELEYSFNPIKQFINPSNLLSYKVSPSDKVMVNEISERQKDIYAAAKGSEFGYGLAFTPPEIAGNIAGYSAELITLKLLPIIEKPIIGSALAIGGRSLIKSAFGAGAEASASIEQQEAKYGNRPFTFGEKLVTYTVGTTTTMGLDVGYKLSALKSGTLGKAGKGFFDIAGQVVDPVAETGGDVGSLIIERSFSNPLYRGLGARRSGVFISANQKSKTYSLSVKDDSKTIGLSSSNRFSIITSSEANNINSNVQAGSKSTSSTSATVRTNTPRTRVSTSTSNQVKTPVNINIKSDVPPPPPPPPIIITSSISKNPTKTSTSTTTNINTKSSTQQETNLFTETRISTNVNIGYLPLPPFIPFSGGGGGGGNGGGSGHGIFSQRKVYVPSFRAAAFGIRGRPSGLASLSGLGERPIIGSYSRPSKTKKRFKI